MADRYIRYSLVKRTCSCEWFLGGPCLALADSLRSSSCVSVDNDRRCSLYGELNVLK